MLARLAPAAAVLVVACASAGETGDPLAAPPLTPVEELRLDPHVEDFSVIPAVGVGPRGQIAVLQPQDGQVRLYDSTGATSPRCASACHRSIRRSQH